MVRLRFSLATSTVCLLALLVPGGVAACASGTSRDQNRIEGGDDGQGGSAPDGSVGDDDDAPSQDDGAGGQGGAHDGGPGGGGGDRVDGGPGDGDHGGGDGPGGPDGDTVACPVCDDALDNCLLYAYTDADYVYCRSQWADCALASCDLGDERDCFIPFSVCLQACDTSPECLLCEVAFDQCL